MDEIEKELEEKSIERTEISEVVVEDKPPTDLIENLVPEGPVSVKPKKVKKPRSEKQIAAFERAKQKRAENIALKKQKKEDDKIQKKESKKKEKESVPVVVQQDSVSKPVIQPTPHREPVRSEVVNNYYYYGTPPPQQHQQQYIEPIEKKPIKKTRPPTPESSSEEEEVYQPPPETKPQFKFRFA